MPTKVIMPQLGESVVEGTIAKWLVSEGDRIKRDQPIALISTDKIDVEIPAPAEGILKFLIPEGGVAPVGSEIALIGQEGEAEPSKTAVPTPEKSEAPLKGEEPRLSPLVRRLAAEHRVDLSKVKGSGLSGRITKEDILATAAPGRTAAPPAAPPPAEDHTYKPPVVEPQEGDRVLPFSRLRKLTAEHMVFSKRNAAHVTTVAEIDMWNVGRAREGTDLSYLPFVVFAAIEALKEFPQMNAAVQGDSLIIRKAINIGIAVETERGLVVPVIRRADEKSLKGLAAMILDLAVRAREQRLLPDDIAGGTFTVTNPGKKGNLFGTPILMQPQVGILRLGEVTKRPVAVERDGQDTIAIHPMMFLALSYDHRVIDGVAGNEFLHRVKEILQEGKFAL